jgi:hypothetical protein
MLAESADCVAGVEGLYGYRGLAEWRKPHIEGRKAASTLKKCRQGSAQETPSQAPHRGCVSWNSKCAFTVGHSDAMML